MLIKQNISMPFDSYQSLDILLNTQMKLIINMLYIYFYPFAKQKGLYTFSKMYITSYYITSIYPNLSNSSISMLLFLVPQLAIKHVTCGS